MQQPEQSSAGSQRYLLVRCGALRCALPAAAVHRVTRDLTVRPLPGGSPHFLGLAQFGGEPLAVVDLEALVAAAPASAGRRTIVIVRPPSTAASSGLALAVDEVQSLTPLTVSSGPRSRGGLVSGSSRTGGSEICVIDPTVLFADTWSPEEASDA